MKHLFKGVGSLLLDQVVANISAAMLVLTVSVIFKNSLLGYTLAFGITMLLYSYCAYRSGFKSGIRDPRRVPKDPHYRGYLYRGAVEGAFAAVPLLLIYLLYQFGKFWWAWLGFRLADMYWYWPLAGMFPNHQPLIMALAFLPMILFPWLGYIAGYKNFILSDVFLNLYKKLLSRMPEE